MYLQEAVGDRSFLPERHRGDGSPEAISLSAVQLYSFAERVTSSLEESSVLRGVVVERNEPELRRCDLVFTKELPVLFSSRRLFYF